MQNFFDRFKIINGNTLKIIACISMLIDHIAAGYILPVVSYGFYKGNLNIDQLNALYMTMRCIGRAAFPIYCFLLVEGFTYTKSRLRYALSLLVFGLISEIPFDLNFYAKEEVFNPNMLEALAANDYLLENCNVYFTLLIGLLVIWGIESVYKLIVNKNLPMPLYGVAAVAITGIGCYISYLIDSDYDYRGVLVITILYILRTRQPLGIIAGFIVLCTHYLEYWAFPAVILMLLYNHKRGRRLGYFKYFFYIYYPLHLTIIYFSRCLAAM